jgi:hypothetical protein
VGVGWGAGKRRRRRRGEGGAAARELFCEASAYGEEGMLCSVPELKERVLMLVFGLVDRLVHRLLLPLPACVGCKVRGAALPGKDIITSAEVIPNEVHFRLLAFSLYQANFKYSSARPR